MTQVPRREARVKLAIRLSPVGLAAVDKFAADEDRTRSDMIRVLIMEAVQARRKTAART